MHDIEKNTLENRLKIAHEQGFTCGHLALSKVISEYPVDDSALTPGLAMHLRRIFAENQIDVAVLGCYLNLANPNEESLKKITQRYLTNIRFASILGAGVVGTDTGAVNEKYATEEANFTEEDLAIGLDYAGQAPSPERVDKDLKNFFEKIRRRRKQRGLPDLKYIAAIGGDEMPAAGYSGKRPHVHVIMNGGIDRDEIEKLWGHGHANTHRLQPRDEGLGGIATYFTRQMQDRPPKMGVKKYRPSKNLIRPEPRSTDAKMPNGRVRKVAYGFENEAKAVMEKLYPGYVFQQCVVRYSDIVPGVYIRCVLRKVKGGGGTV